MDIAQSAVSAIENEKSLPSAGAITNLLKKTSVSAEWVLTGNGFPYRNTPARIVQARLARNMSQKDLAEKTGIELRIIQAVENGSEVFGDDSLEQIAFATQCDLHWLRTGYDRDGKLTPSIFLGEEEAPEPIHATDMVREEPRNAYGLDYDPMRVSTAVKKAFSIVDSEEAKRGLKMNRDYKGIVIGHLTDYVMRGKSEADLMALLQSLIGDLVPPKPKA